MEPTNELRIGAALQTCVSAVRQRLGDEHAAVVIVTPMMANAHLARRQLAVNGSFLRVYFATPLQLVSDYGRRSLGKQGLRRETPAWLHATLLDLLPGLAADGRLGAWAETLQRPTWTSTIAGAVRSAEGALLGPADLRGHGERADVLAEVLGAVEERRTHDGVYGTRELFEAAIDSIGSGEDNAWDRMHGCVLVGDGILPYGAHLALGRWLAERETVRLGLAPFESLEPAPLGLRAAARSDADVVTASSVRGTSLAHVCSNWQGTEVPCADLDGSLLLAATPDEIREVHEAVREVLASIRAGVPLDRIAIALPDSSGADVLEHALRRAGIPATMLVGPPLARTREAQLLRLFLDIATGEETIANWYDLLNHPGILRRGVFRDTVVRGKGRWRRILSRCGASRGTPKILEALEHFASRAREEENFDDETAAQSLHAAVTAMQQRLDGLPALAPPADHAQAWRALIREHCRYTTDRQAVEKLLDGWGPPGMGPPTARTAALAMLTEELGATERLVGTLTDQAIIVAPPMALYGGDFDVVCVLALTQGSLPRKYSEDVFITDELVGTLCEAHGERLVDARTVEQAESRRFAAAVSAASGRLWLSIPRTEMVEGRPTLPSTFVLDILGALHGRRVRYGEVQGLCTRRGKRTGFGCDKPADAINATEHILARLATDPAATLPRLATHATARRLFQLRRSVDRLRHDPDALPDAWSGIVAPDRLPVPLLDGSADAAFRFERAVSKPGTYLFTHVLGAWGPPNLRPRLDLLSKYAVARRVQTAVVEIANLRPEQMREAFEALLRAGLTEELQFHPDALRAEVDECSRAALAVFDELMTTYPEGPVQGEQRGDDAGTIPELGWTVTLGDAFVGSGELQELVTETKVKSLMAKHHLALVLTALAARAAGHDITDVTEVGFTERCTGPLSSIAEEVLATAQLARRRAAQGFWPIGEQGKRRRYSLEAETPLNEDQSFELTTRLEQSAGRDQP